MDLGNVKHLISIRHPHRTSGKHCAYGIYSDAFKYLNSEQGARQET